MQEGDPLDNFETINRELERHNPQLLEKTQIVVLTKTDITEVRERIESVLPFFEGRGYRVFPISAVTGDGVPELVAAVGGVLETRRRLQAGETDETP
jgi:GTP-binding protein